MLKARFLVFAEFVTLDLEWLKLESPDEHRVAGPGNVDDTRNPPHGFEHIDFNLKDAISAVARRGWIDAEGIQIRSLEPDLLLAEILERAHKESRAAQKHDAERNLHADRNLAETLRSFVRLCPRSGADSAPGRAHEMEMGARLKSRLTTKFSASVKRNHSRLSSDAE